MRCPAGEMAVEAPAVTVYRGSRVWRVSVSGPAPVFPTVLIRHVVGMVVEAPVVIAHPVNRVLRS